MENLNNTEKTSENAGKELRISDVSDSLKKILKDVKSKSKKKKWMGANVHSSAYDEGKNDVIEILEDILKNYH